MPTVDEFFKIIDIFSNLQNFPRKNQYPCCCFVDYNHCMNFQAKKRAWHRKAMTAETACKEFNYTNGNLVKYIFVTKPFWELNQQFFGVFGFSHKNKNNLKKKKKIP